MRVIRPGERLAIDDLKRMASGRFGDMVKAVVDVERGIMAVDAELHADQEALLIYEGSQPGDLWGINLYPDLGGEDFVEFDDDQSAPVAGQSKPRRGGSRPAHPNPLHR